MAELSVCSDTGFGESLYLLINANVLIFSTVRMIYTLVDCPIEHFPSFVHH